MQVEPRIMQREMGFLQKFFCFEEERTCLALSSVRVGQAKKGNNNARIGVANYKATKRPPRYCKR